MCSGSISSRSLGRVSSRVQAAQSLNSINALTLPSSGPVPAGFAVLHGPLKSNVSAQARSMNRSVIRAFASGRVAFERLGQLSLRRLHSGAGAARHRALRHLQLSSVALLRASASKAGKRVSLAERLRTDRQLSRVPEQYTSALAPLSCPQSKWRLRRAPFLTIERANLSFKRTRLRRSA